MLNLLDGPDWPPSASRSYSPRLFSLVHSTRSNSPRIDQWLSTLGRVSSEFEPVAARASDEDSHTAVEDGTPLSLIWTKLGLPPISFGSRSWLWSATDQLTFSWHRSG